MIIYSRIGICPMADEYPYKAPEFVEQEAEIVLNKHRQYCIHDGMKLMLVPTQSEAYEDIKELIRKYPEFYQERKELFERKYTKLEMDKAKAFRMKIEAIFCGYDDEDIYHSYSCDICKFYNKQIKDYEIPPKEWRNRDLVFSTYSTFYLAEGLKKEIEKLNATNVWFRPGWSRKDKSIPVAYQIEVNEYLPKLKELNHWQTYKICSECGKEVLESNFKDPIYVTKDILDSLKDFNATQETFTEISAREYIVSRRIFELFKNYGVKKMRFEPVFIKE